MRFARLIALLLSAGIAASALGGSDQASPSPPPAAETPTPPTGALTPKVDESAKAHRLGAVEIEARRKAEQEKNALIDRALSGMGGAERVDSVKTLILVGKTRTTSPEGPVETEDRTTIRFPHFYRLDITVGAGKFSKLAVSEGVYLIGPTGAVQLPEAEKRRVESSIMRNPLMLMKTRRDRAFSASPAGVTRIGGRAVDLLDIRVVFDSTTLAVDRENGRILELRYKTRGGEQEKEALMTVSYSDFRTVDGLSFPFVSESSFDGKNVSQARLREIQVDRTVDSGLFQPPPLVLAAPPTPTATPALPGHVP
jgi:hypothetical protein